MKAVMYGFWKDGCHPTAVQCIDCIFVLIVCFVLCLEHKHATVSFVPCAFVWVLQRVEQIRVVINLPENKLS